MRGQQAAPPNGAASPGGVEVVLLPRVHDIGGFEVRRALPAQERQMVGPFIFFDQAGPGEFLAGRMLVFRARDHVALRAGPQGARVLLLGGAAMDGPRHLFWNFVSSSRERIEQAKADWRAGRFGKVPGDEA